MGMMTLAHARRLAALGLVAVLAAGCGATQTPSLSPVLSVPPASAGSSPIAAATVTPAATAGPTPGPSLLSIPTPTVVPAGARFDVSWSQLPGREAPSRGGSLSDPFTREPPTAVRFGAGAVVAYPTETFGSDSGPMIWWSPDLVTWSRVVAPEPPSDPDPELALNAWARQVVVGGPGLAVLGGNANENDEIEVARIWTSTDGEHWQEGVAPEDARFIWGRQGRLVAFGRSTWISPDGRTWVEAGPSPFATMEFLQQARAVLVDDGDGAIVLARAGFDSPTSVHRVTSDGEWEQLAEIDGYVRTAVRGPTGIVALGSSFGDDPRDLAWTSADGRTWERHASVAPAGTLVATAVGYVVVGERSYYQGCDGFDPSAQVVNTWTSPDGVAWDVMPEDGAQNHVDLPVVLADGDRLVAIGLKWATEGGGNEFENRSTPSVWASGPLVPPKAPAPKATASGCGG